MVQVSLSTTTTYGEDVDALVEDQRSALTVRFGLDTPAPAGGLKVYIDSDTEQIINRLDLPGFAFNPTTENINPTTFGTNFDNSGIVLTIDEGATFGTFTISVFDNPEPDTFLPETFDGRVDALFSLKTQNQVDPADQNDINGLSDYTIDTNAASSTVTFVDEESQLVDPPQPPTEPPTGPAPEQPLVSLRTGPTTLIESEGTVSAHVFNVTGLLPAAGLVVSVSASNLGEFDLSAVEVVDGEMVAVREGGFDLRLTDYTTLINLPIAEDGTAEGLEAAVFTLAVGDGYAVNPDFISGQFNLVDTAADAPAGGNEPDDTIGLAVNTGLSAANPSVTFSNELDFDIGNRYQNEDGSFTYVDATEDVDFYKVSLSAGDMVAFDVDAVVKGEQDIVNLMRDRTQASVIFRLFDAAGNELAARDSGQGPGELFATSTDPYLEFQATEAGDYYLGLSVFSNGVPYRFGGDQFGNAQQYIERAYDPFVPASGDGDARGGLDFRGLGGYDLEITLNPENLVMLAEQRDRSTDVFPAVIDLPAPGEPTVSLDFIAATYDPDDNLIDDNIVEGLENQGSILTLIIETEGDIPPEGLLVTVNSNTYLRDYYTVRTLLSPPFTPGAELVDVVTDSTGRETGVQLRVFSPKTFLPLNARTQLRGEVIPLETDGPETATFFLQGGEGYGVSELNNNITATFYDTPDQAPAPTVIPEVSLTVSEPVLVESEGTETTFTFTLSEPPPAGGVVVYAKAEDPLLGRFDVLNADIAGGAFPFPNGDFNGFYFKITEKAASITLKTIENSLTEGLVTYNLSLQSAPFYTVNETASSVMLTIGDTPESIVLETPPELPPILEEFGPNDTIPEAVPLPLRREGETIRGGLLPREDGIERADYRDFSEDVDFYSFELEAGETAKIDVNAIPFELPRFPGVEQKLDSELRLFDEAGNELASVNNAASPGEESGRDPYLEFTATEAGAYYVGISQLGNRDYDPFEARSGSGWVFPEIGVFSGEYDLSLDITPANNNPPVSELPDRVITALDDALDNNLPAEVPGAAVAILTPGGEWFGASGVSNVAENTPLQPGDRFEAGSITKTFVATTLLQLVEENQLALTDTLTDWLPAALTDLVPNASEITIEQILGHTSGIADYLDILAAQALSNPRLFLEDWQPEALIGFIDGVDPFFEPGTDWQYSNTNYILAGSVIEAVTGNSYGQEIRDRILDPLDLSNTFVFGEEEIPGGYIKSYWDFDSNGSLDDLSITNLSWTGSAGSIISNTEDLADFFDGLLVDGALLKPETLAEMLDTIPVDSPNYDEYGLGIGTLESRDRFWYVHRGQTLGFRSNLWYSPLEEITYVELLNGRSSSNLVSDLLPTYRRTIAPPIPDPITYEFDWTGQIAGFSVEGEFTYDASDSLTDGIVREENLASFDIFFFDPAGNLLKTYEDNHLTFDEFNFAFDPETKQVLTDGLFDGPEGINVGEKTAVGDGFAGLNLWSKSKETSSSLIHIDDWSDEFGFPLGYSSHEDIAFLTQTTAELIETGKVGESYLDDTQDSLEQVGEMIAIAPPANNAGKYFVTSGVTSLFLDFSLFESAGLLIQNASPTATPFSNQFQLGFEIADTTDFGFQTLPFTPTGGTINHTGDISFVVGNDTDLTIGDFSVGFDVNRVSDTASGFFVADTLEDGLGIDILFDLGVPDRLLVQNIELTIADADLLLAPELAAILGIVDAVGTDVGDVRADADLTTVLGPLPQPEILGSELADMLLGGGGADLIVALGGDDTVSGGLGDDQIMGGDGDDVLRGDFDNRGSQNGKMGGTDIIFGGAGNDRISGKGGNDILSGDGSDDFIWGDAGDDFIMGGMGNDVLVGDNFSGGSGSDLFVFGNGDGTATILDFEVGTDRIGLVESELTFADLTLTQDGGTTVLGVTSSGETLAVFNGVQVSSLTESSFEVVADISSLEDALALA